MKKKNGNKTSKQIPKRSFTSSRIKKTSDNESHKNQHDVELNDPSQS